MIVVIGESLLDLIVMPTGDVTARLGGGPFTVSRAIARLDQPVTFVGTFSHDSTGERIRAALQDDGVTLGCPEPVEAPSTMAIAEVDDTGAATYRFLLDDTAGMQVTPTQALAALTSDTDALFVGGLGLTQPPIADACEAAVASADDTCLVMIDPNCRLAATLDVDTYRERLDRLMTFADVVKVSDDDVAMLAPDAHSPRDIAQEWARNHDVVVLLTAGPNAVHVVTKRTSLVIDVPQVDIVDTIGAGDVFCGAFLAYWTSRGFSCDELHDNDLLRAATEYAIDVARLTCQQVGADPPHAHELA